MQIKKPLSTAMDKGQGKKYLTTLYHREDIMNKFLEKVCFSLCGILIGSSLSLYVISAVKPILAYLGVGVIILICLFVVVTD